ELGARARVHVDELGEVELDPELLGDPANLLDARRHGHRHLRSSLRRYARSCRDALAARLERTAAGGWSSMARSYTRAAAGVWRSCMAAVRCEHGRVCRSSRREPHPPG